MQIAVGNSLPDSPLVRVYETFWGYGAFDLDDVTLHIDRRLSCTGATSSSGFERS